MYLPKFNIEKSPKPNRKGSSSNQHGFQAFLLLNFRGVICTSKTDQSQKGGMLFRCSAINSRHNQAATTAAFGKRQVGLEENPPDISGYQMHLSVANIWNFDYGFMQMLR